jgi:hypothetical protein
MISFFTFAIHRAIIDVGSDSFSLFSIHRVIDVGSEWRTFSNEKGGEDRSRVGGPENTLLGSGDLSTIIGKDFCSLILSVCAHFKLGSR